MNYTIQRITLGLLFLMSGLLYAAKPIFLITPTGAQAPRTIYAGQTVSVSYLVTNNTPFHLNSNGLVHLPPGVVHLPHLLPGLTQATSDCANPFNLPVGGSCILNLLITADKLEGNLTGGPEVCNTIANPIYCSRPSAGNELNMVKNTNPPPVPPVPPVTRTTISANPTVFSLVENGGTQTVTITNNGPINAHNVSVTTLPGLGVTVLSNNCPSSLSFVAPNNTCQVTFQSSTTPGNTTATISGSNIQSPVVLTITVGNAPIISITNPGQPSSFYVNLDTPQALQLTIASTNTPGSLATNISATLPVGWTNASVDVSNCQGLQPGATCILTLNTSSPYAPGTLTINGTNGANTLTPLVATYMGGGLVFSVNGTVKVAQQQTTTSLQWQLGGVNTIPTDVNDGATNTSNIVGAIGPGTFYAAGYCQSLSATPPESNDTGWYLPAICELGGNGLHGPGGCSTDNVNSNMLSLFSFDSSFAGDTWSSTEKDIGNNAWFQTFSSSGNDQSPAGESVNFLIVRCVRAFTA